MQVLTRDKAKTMDSVRKGDNTIGFISSVH